MNKEIKDKWVKALRSGEYEQGRGCLKKYDTYCCLGVLCDIHAKETGNEWESINDYEYSYFNSMGSLPFTVKKWAGISSTCIHANKNIKIGLIAMNDDGKPFTEIADIIEEYL